MKKYMAAIRNDVIMRFWNVKKGKFVRFICASGGRGMQPAIEKLSKWMLLIPVPVIVI